MLTPSGKGSAGYYTMSRSCSDDPIPFSTFGRYPCIVRCQQPAYCTRKRQPNPPKTSYKTCTIKPSVSHVFHRDTIPSKHQKQINQPPHPLVRHPIHRQTHLVLPPQPQQSHTLLASLENSLAI